MLTSFEEQTPSRPSTPRSRRSTPPSTPAERIHSQRRYATRSTIPSKSDTTSSTHSRRVVPASALKPPSKREALFTLRRKLHVETIPLNRIPSFMDHFLNYQSPSVDYDSEEIMLELAYRIKLNKLHYVVDPSTPRKYVISRPDTHHIQLLWAEQDTWTSMTAAHDGFDGVSGVSTQSRLPDSFERSTSSWTEA
ncbi:hypothetical protein PQX77_008510 [Marasmius sp. AFHP31]|nr:hypothetical protein PQX77_008510 [Marasmius sp. AFHP31]